MIKSENQDLILFSNRLFRLILRSCNYICHFLTIKKSLGDQLGWVRDGFEGAQDYDLILRCTENQRK